MRPVLAILIVLCSVNAALGTVPAASPVAGPYACDGSDTTFTIPTTLGLDDDDDLQVVLIDANGVGTVLTKTTHYSITGANTNDPQDLTQGGTVTTVTAYSSDYTILLRRSTSLASTLDIDDEDVEEAIDRSRRIDQELAEMYSRSLHVPIAEAGWDANLPTQEERAGGYLGFGDDGAVQIVASAIPDANVSPLWNDVVVEPNLTSSLTALGAGSWWATPLGYSSLASLWSHWMGGRFNVAHYGAVGDGETDDTLAVAATLTAAASATYPGTGQQVFFPAGTFKISASLQLENGISIEGTGRSSYIVQATADTPIFAANADRATQEIEIHDLRLGVTASTTGVVGIQGAAGYYMGNAIVEGVWFDPTLSIGIDATMANTVVYRCFFGDRNDGDVAASCAAIYVRGVSGLAHFGNQVSHCRFYAAQDCNGVIESELGDTLTINQCVFDQLDDTALYARGTYSVVVQSCIVEDVNGNDPNGYDTIFDISDAPGGTSYGNLRIADCRIVQDAGLTGAIVGVKDTVTVKIEGCRVIAGDNYWTIDTGNGTVDKKISLLMDNGATLVSAIAGLRYMATNPLRFGTNTAIMTYQASASAPSYSPDYSIYLDTGANTGGGDLGFRYYDGSQWLDVAPVGGLASHDYGAGTTAWTLTTAESQKRLFVVTNAGGATSAAFPAVCPGKMFAVYNNSGAAITFKVTGQTGAATTNGKYSIWTMNSTDAVKLYEQP